MPKYQRWMLTLLVGGAIAVLAAACNYSYAPFSDRVDSPVVMTAADVGVANLNLNPARALAYRWDGDGGSWVQIAVQIDERHVVDFGSRPSTNSQSGAVGTVYGTSPTGTTALQYSDPNTWVGADPDPTFDANDELVFMARDAGPRAPAGTVHPSPAIGGLGKEIVLSDPDGGDPGYVYLFYGGAGVDPSAGLDLVDYQFVLDSGSYRPNYKRADGPNPESSTVTTDTYSMGLSDRWFTVDLDLGQGDILDGHKSQFALNFCGRSNQTFANAHGAFAANIDGPVRAIRSYIGANSGPLTQRTEIFYDTRYESITDLRVHSIPGIMSFLDLNASAIGMNYRSSTMASAVTIDGAPDSVPAATPDWFYAHGNQGYLTRTFDVTSSFNAPSAQVFLDDTNPPDDECWGDGSYFGAGGVHFNERLPNTDPDNGFAATFTATEVTSFWSPNLNPDVWTPTWAAQATQPLTTSSTNF